MGMSDKMVCDVLVEGGRYLLPVDIPVTAIRPPAATKAAGLAWLLLGPGGWGQWAINDAGAIVAIRAGVKKRPDVVVTGWTVEHLRAWPAGVEGNTLDAESADIDTWQDNHGVKHL